VVKGHREEPIIVAAKDEVRRILKEHKPTPLDSSVKSEIKAILKEYDTKLHGKPISTKYLDRLG